MATPAPPTPMTLVASQPALGLAGPGEPVPVAFVGRTSTLELQDPVASLRRQVRSSQAALPPGWFIAAWYWDIESGGLDLEHRSQGEAYRQFAAAGIPRDGGMADLLAEAASPDAPVRRGDLRGHRAVRPGHLQRAEAGEEAVPAGHPAVRHRRADRHRRRQRHHRPGPPGQAGRGGMVPAAAEGEDLEGPGRARPGRVEHRPRRLRVHRRPGAAPGPGQGQPGPDQDPPGPGPGPRPGRGADLHLAGRAQARHAHHRRPAERRPGPLPAPRPRSGWTTQTVYAILGNPKYTGHMVYGRVRTRNGRRVTVPPDQWLWSPAARPPGDHRPGHLGRRPGHRRRARHQPGRPRPVPAPGRDPDLRLPRPGPLPGLPTPHGRPGLRPRPAGLLPVPAQPGPAQGHRRPPRIIPAPSRPPRSDWTRSPGCSSPSTSSAPAAPSCSPPSCPPPTTPPPPTATPRPPR